VAELFLRNLIQHLQGRVSFFGALVIIFALAAFVLFSNVDLGKTNLHADEPGWVSSGYIHTELLINLISNRASHQSHFKRKF